MCFFISNNDLCMGQTLMEPLRILGREYSMEILGATREPKSATRLSDSLDIPIATCYRRVGELTAVGLLEEHTSPDDDTTGAARYRRTTDAVGVRFAPTPSLFAWTRVRGAVGADASSLDVSRPGQSRSAPVGASGPRGMDITERQDLPPENV